MTQEEVIEWLSKNKKGTVREIAKGIGKCNESVRVVCYRLFEHNEIERETREDGQKYWYIFKVKNGNKK